MIASMMSEPKMTKNISKLYKWKFQYAVFGIWYLLFNILSVRVVHVIAIVVVHFKYYELLNCGIYQYLYIPSTTSENLYNLFVTLKNCF